MDGALGNNTLEFDLGQKWAKGLRIRFCSQAESAQADRKDGAFLKQIHSKKIVEWSAYQAKSGAYANTEADGFFARGEAFKNSKQKLYVRTADCAPLFFVDRENECLAAIHAGWRGLAQGIHLVPFSQGFQPKTTWIWCGPCLNGASFEVAEDMWSQFSANDQRDFFVQRSSNGESATLGKKFFNTWDFLEATFKRLGVQLFYNVDIDTYTNPAYASYRRWKKSATPEPNLQHNYSWAAFV